MIFPTERCRSREVSKPSGCCSALMASLFALGVMSVVWMAFVGALIAIEKILPWRRPVSYGTALVLSALGVLILVAPGLMPALSIPQGPMPAMGRMGAWIVGPPVHNLGTTADRSAREVPGPQKLPGWHSE
jgi:Predicted metal-binding integral membrane protein (DUF2182)